MLICIYAPRVDYLFTFCGISLCFPHSLLYLGSFTRTLIFISSIQFRIFSGAQQCNVQCFLDESLEYIYFFFFLVAMKRNSFAHAIVTIATAVAVAFYVYRTFLQVMISRASNINFLTSTPSKTFIYSEERYT